MNKSPNSSMKPSRAMLILGYSGLIPFLVLSFVVHVGLFELHHDALTILKAYSFGIIAFLCGSIWPNNGDDTHNNKSLISNALFLVAFFSFVFLSEHWLVMAAAILITLYLIEHHTQLTGQFNASYKRLRQHLTIGASISLILAYGTYQSI